MQRLRQSEDRLRVPEGMETTETMSMLSLESCKGCRGTGRVGSANGYAIFCETCGDSGMMWVERCFLREKIPGRK